jgi:EAL domain-containing protein (putative c-di-GMP-specific phosphodiesterase class I)/DNA-binding NarL/FixJ family response regulator
MQKIQEKSVPLNALDWSSHAALVVEDSAVQRAHMVSMLRSLGFGLVLEAWNGADALEVLEQYCRSGKPGVQGVQLVLTDLDMPRMDGIELIRHLNERKLTESLIVMSARDPRLLELVENMDADNTGLTLLGTLLKPVMMDELNVLLRRVGHVRQAPAVVMERPELTLGQLEQALAASQFVPVFQPKISMNSGLIKGLEALARWRHPEQGLLAPWHFISSLEGTPLMAGFTLSIVEQSLARLVEWQRIGLTSMKVSINLSADILAERTFIDQLDDMVESFSISPELVIWEITETMVMNNLAQALANVARLRLKGYGLAMDDYGIGYSSIQQLSRCPFTELKIDRMFVDGASQRPNRRVILESAIEMGQRLGVTTVAEGVEKLSDWALLRELGCELAQGYMIARPMPAGDIAGWIKSNRARLRQLSSPAAALR